MYTFSGCKSNEYFQVLLLRLILCKPCIRSPSNCSMIRSSFFFPFLYQSHYSFKNVLLIAMQKCYEQSQKYCFVAFEKSFITNLITLFLPMILTMTRALLLSIIEVLMFFTGTLDPLYGTSFFYQDPQLSSKYRAINQSF